MKQKNPSLKENNNEIIPKERSAEQKIKLGMKHKPLFLITFFALLYIFSDNFKISIMFNLVTFNNDKKMCKPMFSVPDYLCENPFKHKETRV